MPLTELGFRYHDPELPQGRRTRRALRATRRTLRPSARRTAGRAATGRAWTRSTTPSEGAYDGALDVSAVAPFGELAKVLRLIHSGGVAEDGTGILSAAALRIALQPVTDCGCFKYSPEGQCEVLLSDACRGDYWGLGACMLSGAGGRRAPRAHRSDRAGAVAWLKSQTALGGDGAAVEQLAEGPVPARIGWSAGLARSSSST